jgi:hypothetical protein
MKKIIKITEKELKNLIPVLLEEFNINDYSDEDFVEVFVKYFRNWVKKKHGDEIGGYPMSLLFKKYTNEFLIDVEIPNENYYHNSSIVKFAKIGRDIIRKQLETLPSLTPNEKFTEKYKKQLIYLIKYLNIPDYVKFNIEEKRPNEVSIEFEIDFPSMLISDNIFVPSQAFNKLKKYLEDFMGIELGSPSHGLLRLNYYSRVTGGEEFIREIFNKQIKPNLKKLPSGSAIHSMKVHVDTDKFTMTLAYKQNSYNSDRQMVKQEIKKYFEKNGFNPNKIIVND